MLTRHACYTDAFRLEDLDDANLLANPDRWAAKAHADVALDGGLTVRDYYDELAARARSRRAAAPLVRHTQAPRHFNCPLVYEPPVEPVNATREEAAALGIPYVEWRRPRAVDLNHSRPLLTTGRYADKE